VARLFVSQAQMDQWTAGGKVGLRDDLMTVPAMNRTFRIEGAVRFIKVVDGEDSQGLVGKVKSVIDLAALGAEHYGNSVILDETAYECEEGFLGAPEDAAAGTDGEGLASLGR
jgi:hypothetical protein